MSIKQIYDGILEFENDDVVAGVNAAIAEGVDSDLILNEGLIGAMDEVGKLFSQGNLYVPEMLMAAEAMKEGLTILKPHLKKAEHGRGKILIGTVFGDHHDIGKNLVAMMLEGAGFEVVDLGVDVPIQKFIDAAKEEKSDIICLSALLTTTMANLGDTVEAIKASGLKVKTLVGGAPVNQSFADKISADGYAPDAGEAVFVARKILSV
ncbi:MAG: cobalamin B12-binding domain-containing protein [Eubacteriaceae bacterium]